LSAIFLLGLWAGANLEIVRQEDHQAMRVGLQTTIAVVNADIGVELNGEMQNFSSAIIDTLDEGFVLVSPAMAQMGYTDGIYGAIVTFPSNVSAQILSFNAYRPERVRLDFQINAHLLEAEYLETHFRIMNLQRSINTMLSYTFVSSIFGQFHMAQDHIDRIFANDLATIDALSILDFPNFTTLLQLDELPDVPFEPNEVDTSEHLLAVTDFGRNISAMYRAGFDIAARDYIRMRDDLILLTYGFFDQKDAWLSELTDWTNISVEYGNNLEEFSASSEKHMAELEIWHGESVEWIEAVKKYEADLDMWSDDLHYWFENYAGWRQRHYDYWEEVLCFSDALLRHRNLLGNLEQFEADMLEWREDAKIFTSDTHKIFLEVRDQFKDQLEPMNRYLTELNDWYMDLDYYESVFLGWNASIQSIMPTLQTGFADLMYRPDFESLIWDPWQLIDELIPWLEGLDGFVGTLDTFLNNPAFEPNPTLPELPSLRPGFKDDLAEVSFPIEWEVDETLKPPGPNVPDLLFPRDPPDPPEPPERPEMSTPPIYPGSESLGPVDEPPQATMELPENPLVDPPPRPDDFWASLELKHDQLLSFDIDDYLTDALIAQVDGMLAAYESYLDTVRADLAGQFEANVMLLFEAYFEYGIFLAELRGDTLQAEADGVEHLHELIAEYFGIATENSDDTQDRMSVFAGMMPESRTTTGVNYELVSFTVAPFELGSPAVRTALEWIQTDLGFLLSAAWVLGGLFLFALLCIVAGYLRARHKAKRQAERAR